MDLYEQTNEAIFTIIYCERHRKYSSLKYKVFISSLALTSPKFPRPLPLRTMSSNS